MTIDDWLPLAKQGIAKAQYNLGLIYSKGKGVTPDYEEALSRNNSVLVRVKIVIR